MKHKVNTKSEEVSYVEIISLVEREIIKRNWKPAKLSKISGVPPGTISRFLHDDGISGYNLHRIYEALGIIGGGDKIGSKGGLETSGMIIPSDRGTLVKIPDEILEIIKSEDEDAIALLKKYAVRVKGMQMQSEILGDEKRYLQKRLEDQGLDLQSQDEPEMGIEDVLEKAKNGL